MKAAVNGALNLSVLDGWWAEGYSPGCGWAIGGGEQYDDPEENDAVEAEALYSLLEREVIPMFFDRDASGRPREWTAMMTNSIQHLGAEFNTGRMVRDYAERAYLPAHRALVALAADSSSGARRLAAWRERMQEAWPQVSATSSVAADGPVAVGSDVRVDVRVNLGGLSPDDVRVEVVAGVRNGDGLSPAQRRGGHPRGQGRRPGALPRRGAHRLERPAGLRRAGRAAAPRRRRPRAGLPHRLGRGLGAPPSAARGLKSVLHPADEVWTCPSTPSAAHPRGSSSTVPSPSARGPARRWPAATATPVSPSPSGCGPRSARSRCASTATTAHSGAPRGHPPLRRGGPRCRDGRRGDARGHPRGPGGPAGRPAGPGASARPLI